MLTNPNSSFAFNTFFDEANTLNVPKGKIMQLTGEECSNFFLVTSGIIKVFTISGDSRENTLYRITTNETCVITTSCLMSAKPFPAIAEAETDVVLQFMSKAQFGALFDHSSEFRNNLLQLLSSRIGLLVDTIAMLGTFSIEHRLAKRLIGYNRKIISATHQQIADEIGSSREVVSRQLKQLENSGAVSLSRGKIEILDVNALSNLI